MTGDELHELLLAKWGRSYDVQLRRAAGKVFVQVMWKYLEQVSFPMTEEEYLAHLDAVASYITEWDAVEQLQQSLRRTRERPHVGRAVSIPIELGGRASEWLLEES